MKRKNKDTKSLKNNIFATIRLVLQITEHLKRNVKTSIVPFLQKHIDATILKYISKYSQSWYLKLFAHGERSLHLFYILYSFVLSLVVFLRLGTIFIRSAINKSKF